ncbi:TPA: succinate dehydrogenase [Klebsiella quasipneumoniae]|nr:succinate dehydrogenase [Klebsiella quasipneumoniae subsp. quasipneumoniae]HBT6082264.1 succinate dehydrogenase [Klebsiella quasipneumoniae]HBT6126752.1 succinate dehydrogenase [Klebsiella quasipneumoniae]HBT6223797.1 succinate dehydrogenase [Klebsiella quasipneumoniae]HBT6241915.1 succinate dehydrogenase [Klebsiella quasipneumoniae]
MRTCMIAGGNILFLFHYSFLNVLSPFLHAINKVIPAAFIVG